MKRSLLILVIACAAMGAEAHDKPSNVFEAFAHGWRESGSTYYRDGGDDTRSRPSWLIEDVQRRNDQQETMRELRKQRRRYD